MLSYEQCTPDYLHRVEIQAENARLKHERSQAQLELQRQRLELRAQEAGGKKEGRQLKHQMHDQTAQTSDLLDALEKAAFSLCDPLCPLR